MVPDRQGSVRVRLDSESNTTFSMYLRDVRKSGGRAISTDDQPQPLQ